MSLVESARQWVLANLPFDRGDAVLTAYLNQQEADTLLMIYHNWMVRRLQPRPRRVIESSAFRSNALTARRAADFHQIKDDIEHGRDLRKYLSRDVERAVVLVPGGRRRQDLDLMLNDWGVHHLHISSEVEADGFVKRSGPLLFVAFRPDRAYFIDVFDHKSFHKERVLEILVQEWPNDGLIHEIKGVVGVSPQLTEDERRSLRKNHAGVAFEHAGKVYWPNGGLSAAGYSVDAVTAADRLLDKIEVFEKTIAEHPDALKGSFQAAGLEFPEVPILEFVLLEDGPAVFESTTGTLLKGAI